MFVIAYALHNIGYIYSVNFLMNYQVNKMFLCMATVRKELLDARVNL